MNAFNHYNKLNDSTMEYYVCSSICTLTPRLNHIAADDVYIDKGIHMDIDIDINIRICNWVKNQISTLSLNGS
jgi:hypothetical protein